MAHFLEMYLEHTKIYESPTSFWLWSGYATIAAVLRDSAYHLEGDNKLYANIYVLFLAGSGARKNNPVKFSEALVKGSQCTKVISGRASIQGILDELSHTETDRHTGTILKGGSAIFYAPELAAGIVGDSAAISILTDIYDGKTDFKSVLRHSPTFKVDQIVFSALMASNEVMIKEFFDERASHGGMLARTLLITPDEFRPSNSLWTDEETARLLKESMNKILDQLKLIGALRGQFFFSKGARDEFDKWYMPFRNKIKKVGDPSGVLGRMHTSCKKVAMLIAANELTLTVEGRHVEKAIDTTLALMPNYNAFILGSGKSDVASKGGAIINSIYAKGVETGEYVMSRRDILNQHWQDIGTAEDIDKILSTLEGGGLLTLIIGGNSQEYQLTKRVIERLDEGRKKNEQV